jgi:hypothetical protein
MTMARNIAADIAELERQSVDQLHNRFAETFGEPARVSNKAWLVKRIAWRLQTLVEGGLSERARCRATELARDADLRLAPPAKGAARATSKRAKQDGHDARLPQAGTVLARRYKGRVVQVAVLADGFSYDGKVFPSLSAVAKAITGSHWNGFRFFGLAEGGGR